MILYVVGFFFTFIYLIINLFILIKKSSMKKKNKIIIGLGVILVATYMIFGSTIKDKLAIGYRKFDEEITLGKEFLLYECEDEAHRNEKVYMTINKIYNEKGSDDREIVSTLMDFDLRYDGVESIKLVDDIDIQIETRYKIQHDGKNIREKISK